MKKTNFIFVGLLFSMFIGLISFNTPKVSEIQKWEMPEVQFPKDNPYSIESIELGGALFSERLFSQDTSISCQSCHMTHMALTDQVKLGEGIFGRKVTRNTPTLNNIGLHPYLMRDGKFLTLEDQVLGPLKDHREFNLDKDELLKRLKSVSYLDKMSQKAYGSDLTIEIIQKAIANFERILVSKDTPFDAYMNGDINAISISAQNGYTLFKSDRLNCVKCHSGFDFTDYSFQNNGTYKNYIDLGRALVTKNNKDIGKFKVPTLRNLNLTFPYMHDGSFQSLEKVILHYEQGGKDSKTKSTYVRGFELTDNERKDLLQFLSSLTEYRYLQMDE
ncbi:MAG: c-type cytochrome [Crocinitomicaceae bacterium]|nr:c-type cytochrome [Flavobacteriales bacterium]NQZ37049.1 c-type cytochrome [Crocinitomicaceae bacterium]